MNRRLFLENTGKFGMALGLAKIVNPLDKIFEIMKEPLSEKDIFFKLSLAQWSLHKTIWTKVLDPLDFSKKAKELGFDGVEYVLINFML